MFGMLRAIRLRYVILAKGPPIRCRRGHPSLSKREEKNIYKAFQYGIPLFPYQPPFLGVLAIGTSGWKLVRSRPCRLEATPDYPWGFPTDP